MRTFALIFALMLYAWSASHAPKSSVRSPASKTLIKGYNIAWWGTAYGHQWNDGSFSKDKVIELLKLAKAGDAELVRIWLFEDSNQWQFELNEEGIPIALRPEFIPNLIFFLRECKKLGIRANLTLFDGNAYHISRLPEGPKRAWWWNVINDRYSMGTWFLKNIVSPVLDAIEKEGLKESVAQIEIMNEMDAAVKYNMFANKWMSAGSMACQWKHALKKRKIDFGVSVGHHGAEKHYMNGDLPLHCSDYLDLHVYNDTGEIPNCEWFSKMALKGLRFQLGEFGQKAARFDDELQKKVTSAFLSNAKQCGFESALAWRLEDERPGHNREARHSYTVFGDVRPAYHTLRDFEKGSDE